MLTGSGILGGLRVESDQEVHRDGDRDRRRPNQRSRPRLLRNRYAPFSSLLLPPHPTLLFLSPSLTLPSRPRTNTGYDTSWQLPFAIIGRDGVDLNAKWSPHPTSYLSMCVDGFPNMFMSLGPNSIIGAGVLLPILETAVGYAVQAAAKMQRERIRSMEVKRSAVRDFDRYMEVRIARARDLVRSFSRADGDLDWGWGRATSRRCVRASVSARGFLA